MQDAVIYEFLNNEQQQKDCHFIFSVWNLPEESEDQALPYEDEEDEDNGLAQSLAVTTQASSSTRRSNVIELHMEMEDQERALLEEETLEAESTEGALSSLTQYVKNRALRQAAELDEREMEIEALGAEMLAAVSDEEEAPQEGRNLTLGMNQRRAQVRARWRQNFDRKNEEMHASIKREVEERIRRDREDEARRDREYEEESNNELRLHWIEHDDAYASYIFNDVESADEVSSRVTCGTCQGTGLVVDALWVHARRRSAVCSLCDGSGNIMR